MALGSPGVEVQVIDESFYTPAAPGTTPMIFVATGQDKSNASGTGTAQGTTAANAGKVWVITSQRDLTDTFGTPLFYTDATGAARHGDELNEYGLQAAYSLLGVSSRAYVVRADVNLSELAPVSSVPAGDPMAGTYWIDTANSRFGINEWSASGKGSFSIKSPLIIDDSNITTVSSGGVPLDSFGKQGDYAMYITSDNGQSYYNTVFYKTTATASAWVPVADGVDGKDLIIDYKYPASFTTSTVTGSVWIKTTAPGNGASWATKYYNGSTQSWGTMSAPIYSSTQQALQSMDYAGGGTNINVGTLFVESNPDHLTTVAAFKVWRRNAAGVTTVVANNANTSTSLTTSTFAIRETLSSTSTWGVIKTITIPQSTSSTIVSLIPAAISAAGLTNVSATYDATAKRLTFTHALGGDFEITYGNVPITLLTTSMDNVYDAPPGDGFNLLITNWKPLVYEASSVAPVTTPTDGTLWYNPVVGEVDILYHNGTSWIGYLEAFPLTDPAGPIVSATEPKDGDRSDAQSLVANDIWISTANIDQYGKDIYVYDIDTHSWLLQDVSDQISTSGWIFADARWGTSGADVEPASIEDLLLSDYVDPDAPDPDLYPAGMRLWNLRRSGFNVKKYIAGHLNLLANNGTNIRYGDESMTNYLSDRWVTVSSNNEDGSGRFGRHAQRGYIVSKFKSMIDTNDAIRDTDTLVFNLIACPGYPEAIQNMVAFNTDVGQTAFVVGDTPFRLKPNATALTAWGNNTALAYDNGEDGAVSYDEYMGMFYPSGYTNDNAGNNVVVPASHMMLRTIINSDAKSYQWFAPAGTRRGGVDNATSVGYIDDLTGEFKTASLHEGLRNVLHDVKINPIATLPGVGIVNFGQYTRARNASALDRINVVRLISYLRRQLTILAKPYLFEPNDAQTRREIKSAAENLMLELVGQRALYDFIVVCDTSNNTPARIDRSELYLDLAIEPVKAVEFIYIPLRIKNTGEIASGK